MRLYHGTSGDNAMIIKHQGFKESSHGPLGPGIHFTSSYDKVSSAGRGLEGELRITPLKRLAAAIAIQATHFALSATKRGKGSGAAVVTVEVDDYGESRASQICGAGYEGSVADVWPFEQIILCSTSAK
jgi:hypothetical protein